MSETKTLTLRAVLLVSSKELERKMTPLLFTSKTSKLSSRTYEMLALFPVSASVQFKSMITDITARLGSISTDVATMPHTGGLSLISRT